MGPDTFFSLVVPLLVQSIEYEEAAQTFGTKDDKLIEPVLLRHKQADTHALQQFMTDLIASNKELIERKADNVVKKIVGNASIYQLDLKDSALVADETPKVYLSIINSLHIKTVRWVTTLFEIVGVYAYCCPQSL